MINKGKVGKRIEVVSKMNTKRYSEKQAGKIFKKWTLQ